MIRKKLLYSISLLLLVFLSTYCVGSSRAQMPSQTDAVITLDSGTHYQTITGWEATAQAGQLECATFDQYKTELFDRAVNELGINRIRLEVRSGSENPTDYFSQGLSAWHQHWADIVNDNDDPYTINANGFHFSELDYSIDTVVQPLKQRLEANGEKLYVNVTYVDFDTSVATHYGNPEEYAEFVLATFQHIQNKYGWVPDAWEMILEPDNSAWTGQQIGAALAAAGARLESNGFAPDFIAPSNTDMAAAIGYFDQLIQVPGASQYLNEFSYHRYVNASDNNLRTIADKASQYNLNTSMLEHIGSGHEALYADLTIANNSAWQQFTLAYCTSDNAAQYYWIESTGEIHLSHSARFLRQYFKFVRAGAQRIGSNTSNGTFSPVAFINPDGSYVVVVKANSGGAFDVSGLPAGTYNVTYTTNNQYDVQVPPSTIDEGEALNTSIPDYGVLTIYTESEASSPVPPSNVAISGPSDAKTDIKYTFTASVSPATASQPITYIWEVTGKPTKSHTGGLSDTATFTWESTGTSNVKVTARNTAGETLDSHAVSVEVSEKNFLPTMLLHGNPTFMRAGTSPDNARITAGTLASPHPSCVSTSFK